MTFDEILEQVLDILRRRGRVSYRALKRQFDLDDAYLAESIHNPDAKVVKGFPKGVMGPSIQAFQADLAKPETIDALIAYIKSLQ